jgi:PBP1b-binding outer membrane lipoprotein LpoB
MKTIIARFTELKNNVSAADSEFEDLDYNKVDKALKSVGISLKDSMG